jgi:hypothetical protein
VLQQDVNDWLYESCVYFNNTMDSLFVIVRRCRCVCDVFVTLTHNFAIAARVCISKKTCKKPLTKLKELEYQQRQWQLELQTGDRISVRAALERSSTQAQQQAAAAGSSSRSDLGIPASVAAYCYISSVLLLIYMCPHTPCMSFALSHVANQTGGETGRISVRGDPPAAGRAGGTDAAAALAESLVGINGSRGIWSCSGGQQQAGQAGQETLSEATSGFAEATLAEVLHQALSLQSPTPELPQPFKRANGSPDSMTDAMAVDSSRQGRRHRCRRLAYRVPGRCQRRVDRASTS